MKRGFARKLLHIYDIYLSFSIYALAHYAFFSVVGVVGMLKADSESVQRVCGSSGNIHKQKALRKEGTAVQGYPFTSLERVPGCHQPIPHLHPRLQSLKSYSFGPSHGTQFLFKSSGPDKFG